MNIKIKDKVSEIVSLIDKGFNNKEIAEMLGTNPPALRYWQKKLGIKSNPVKINKLSDEQKADVLVLYKEHQNALLVAEVIGSTQHLVLKYLKEMGIDTSNRFFSESMINDVIAQYNAGMTQDEIAKFHGCDRQAVQSLFYREGIKGRTQLEQKQITWYVNQECFTNWENEADLFFYGLLLSDGCILDNGSVSIQLQLSDAHVIEQFKEYIQSDNPVRMGQPSHKIKSGFASFNFKDQVIANNLRLVGMLPRKSAKEKLPSFDLSNLELARHFWRGYICGDGSVRSYPSNGTTRLIPSLHICGSEEVCNGFRLFCENVLGYGVRPEVKKTKDKRRDSDLYYFKINGLSAKIVTLFMFENATYTIQRKTENAMSFKDYIPKIDRVNKQPKAS